MRFLNSILLPFLLLMLSYSYSQAQSMWTINNNSSVEAEQLQFKPTHYQLLTLDETFFQKFMEAIPAASAGNYPFIQLPNPDGELEDFYVFQSPMMEKGLSDKYPGLHTFTAVRVGFEHITAKLDFTYYGFHAMVFNGANTYFIDPAFAQYSNQYISYYKRNYQRLSASMTCAFQDPEEEPAYTSLDLPTLGFKTHGGSKKEYRLALACTGEYAVAVAGANPSKANVLAKMVTSINRINGIYEREIAVHLNLIANTDTLIFLSGTTDPYTNNSGSTMLGENQSTVSQRIGSANYDMGHVFSTGGGGIASLGSVCSSTAKAQGVTGSSNPQGDAFDVDYVAHEMGHQFGGSHTFDANTGSCSGNRSKSSAYEVGSGTTIQAYAGICTGNNTQQHSDDYFHARSLFQISTFLTTGGGNSCGITTATGTTPPVISTPSAIYNVPYKTPFEITASATGASSNGLTYCWEEWDLSNNNSGNNWDDKSIVAPFIRSFNPDTNRTRVFPVIDSVIKQKFAYLGERVADTQRNLRFKVTVRSMNNGIGAFNFMDDSIKLFCYPTTNKGSFEVTYPATSGVNVDGNSSVVLTWNVNGTNTGNINCPNVDITFSADGGRTFPYGILNNTANDGSETVYIPNVATTKGRFKVKGSGNIFFNISKFDLNVKQVNVPADVRDVIPTLFSLQPNPASNFAQIDFEQVGSYTIQIFNAVGEMVHQQKTNEKTANIALANWSKGLYVVKIMNQQGQMHQQKLLVQ